MENKFYNELSKFKKAEKVELAVMNDIEKRSKAIQRDNRAFLDIQREFFDAKRRAENLSALLTDTVNAQEKDLAEATNKLKDLGLDTKQLFKYESQLDDVAFEIKDFKKKIK